MADKTAAAPAVTGPIDESVVEAGTGVGISRTGSEYKDAAVYFQFARLESWGVLVTLAQQSPAPPDDAREALARLHPHVASPRPTAPELTNNLVIDVRTLSGLTTQQIAELAGVTERRALGWRQRNEVPPDKRPTLDALRAAALTLYGGLGPQGVARWLTSGRPSPLELLRDGRIDELRRRTDAFRETIAT